MPIVIQDNAEGDALSYYVNKTTPETLIMRLFTNNVTPAEADTAAVYTEASGSGYASKSLAGASWTITEGAPSQAAFAQQTYTLTGALTAYGYYYTRTTSGRVAGAERFTGAPFTIPAGGGSILITPQITAD